MRDFATNYDPRTYAGGACIVWAPLHFQTLTYEQPMKVEGMKHLPPGQRAKLRELKMISRPVSRAAGIVEPFPTGWTPGQGIFNPRDKIRASIHEELFSGRFCDFYIGGRGQQ